MKNKATRKTQLRQKTYSVFNEIMASVSDPLSQEQRTYQLMRMYQGLRALETAENPTYNDWRVVSDALNMLETLVVDMQVCEDKSGLLQDAMRALAEAGQRNKREGKPIRLDGPGIQAVRAMLANYSELLEILPARIMYRCHRLTEKRLIEILEGKKRSYDVEIV
jgi:hypothetical protein